MAFVQTWQNNITNNLAFCKLLTEDVFDFWQQKVDEEAEEEAAAEEEEESEEEEAPIDFSKYAEQLAQAKTLCDEGKWDEVNKIFEENPEAAEAPEAQKYLLLVELNNPKMNVNRLRSLGNSVIETEPNDPYANYALAIYHFKSKKKDVKKAVYAPQKAGVYAGVYKARFFNILSDFMIFHAKRKSPETACLCDSRNYVGGRKRTRTADLLRVKQAL